VLLYVVAEMKLRLDSNVFSDAGHTDLKYGGFEDFTTTTPPTSNERSAISPRSK
jgi:hypothetical protein